jgi:hypothetical protein
MRVLERSPERIVLKAQTRFAAMASAFMAVTFGSAAWRRVDRAPAQ